MKKITLFIFVLTVTTQQVGKVWNWSLYDTTDGITSTLVISKEGFKTKEKCLADSDKYATDNGLAVVYGFPIIGVNAEVKDGKVKPKRQ